MTQQTLDQRRAAYAWQRAQENRQLGDDYRNLCKGAPALIMGNGLMPALAYWQSRGKAPALALVGDLLGCLKQRFGLPADFRTAMDWFHSRATSDDYMQATDEALEFLKWLRQFADAAKG